MAGRLATGTLAARGAGNPDALAAFIASRARNGQQVLNFSGEVGSAPCPRCGYRNEGVPAVSLSMELATPRYPVTSPNDVMVSRTPQGTASIRHRRGGTVIGEIKQGEQGWHAVYDGRDLRPHSHQRGALAELLSTWNTGTGSAQRPAQPSAIQPPATQTPLMQQFGVPAIRTFAFPNTSSSSGSRTTTASSGSDDDSDDSDGGKGSGLTPKGQAIKKKLLAKGWPDAKADMFARRAQSFGGAKS